jgi:hypothetical protein
MKPRTLRIDDTVLVLERVRAAMLSRHPDGPTTLVYVEGLECPVSLHGDHVASIREALEIEADRRLVLLESPYAGDVFRNAQYARAAMRDSLLRGEFPYASHLLYTQVGILDDNKPAERSLGIVAGLAWGRCAARTVAYLDRGMSDGMRIGIDAARAAGREVEERTIANLEGEWR